MDAMVTSQFPTMQCILGLMSRPSDNDKNVLYKHGSYFSFFLFFFFRFEAELLELKFHHIGGEKIIFNYNN